VLAYSDTGRGPAIVLAHGIGSDRTRWGPIIERLEGDFRCVAVDLPGHGGSPDEGCDSVSATMALHELVKHLQLEPPTVVGHSLGATVALLYGAVYGPRSIVAIDPVGLYLPDLADALAPYADRLRGDDFDAAFGEWEAHLLAPVPASQRAGLQAAIRPRAEVVRSYWSTLLTPGEAAATQAGFDAALAGISVPTLILLAEHPSERDAEVLAEVPSPTVEVCEGGTHFMHLLDPDRFATRIRTWMAELP
jgi:pimeloyl-ACP methyl ester carboxylesterase